MFVLAFALAVQASTLPAITIEPGAGDELVVQVEPFEERRVQEVKEAAARAMTTACKGRPIGWGHLTYNGNVVRDSSRPAMIVGYRQTFRCLDLDPARYPHAPANWKASALDEAAAARTFTTYFAARDAGSLEQAYAMLEPNTHGNREQWMSDQQRARQLIGAQGSRSRTGLQWFLDPPQAPYPGIFARLTFSANFTDAAVYCGSMVLYRMSADSYLVAGVREYILPAGDQPTPERIAEYRKQYCE